MVNSLCINSINTQSINQYTVTEMKLKTGNSIILLHNPLLSGVMY